MTSFWRVTAGIFFLMALSLFFLYPHQNPTGNVVTRLTVISVNAGTCNLTFSSGWNLVSYPCVPFTGYEPYDFLNSVNGSYVSLHTYIASDTADPWKAHNPNLPTWVVQDLATVYDTKGYWINANASDNIYIESTISTPRTLSLVSGWNLVGYPTHSDRPVNLSLSGVYPYWREVKYYNTTTSSYFTFSNSTQTGDFSNFTHYLGYWIYVTQNGDWIITW